MRIQILENANLDLVDGFYFYEQQEQGVGHYFLNCLYSDIDSLTLYGGIHRKKFGFFWSLSKRFPYAIFYDVREDVVFVHAILDCRRDPEDLHKRIEEERTRRWTSTPISRENRD